MTENQTGTPQVKPVLNPAAGEAPEDRTGKTRTLYDAGAGEIFWKNFLAGASRALGALFLYVILTFVFGFLIAQLVWPKLAPLVTQLTSAVGALQNTSRALPQFNFQLPK
jgi:hypothetical protein